MNYKNIINSKGLKQNWIADQIGVTESMLSKVLSGEKRFSKENQKKFHKILGLK